MDRSEWLTERRASVVAAYDDEAPRYDTEPYPNEPQQRWVRRLLEMCPPGAVVLDAPCGTGRYFALVRASGRQVVGADQSAGMLRQAAEHGAMRLDQVSLQQLPYDREFDAVMTIDALENVPPEDWPVVLRRLHQAVRPGGLLYLTVEETDAAGVARAFEALTAQGLPAVPGEVTEGDVAGYHYYPSRDQVLAWIAAEGLEVLDEDYQAEDGWGYRHLLLRDPARRR